MTTSRRKKASLARSRRTTVDGLVKVAEAAVPGLSLLVAHARAIVEERHTRQLEAFLALVLGSAAGSDAGTRVLESLADEPFCLEAFKKVFEDEEEEKTWAYAGLFRAFALQAIAGPDRLRYLRLVRELTNADLLEVVSLEKNRLATRTRAAAGHLVPVSEAKTVWNGLETSQPSLVGALVRWGFCGRRDGTRPPLPAKPFSVLSEILLAAHQQRHASQHKNAP